MARGVGQESTDFFASDEEGRDHVRKYDNVAQRLSLLSTDCSYLHSEAEARQRVAYIG